MCFENVQNNRIEGRCREDLQEVAKSNYVILECNDCRICLAWRCNACTGLIQRYALHGDAMLALACFKDMESKGVKPDKLNISRIRPICLPSAVRELRSNGCVAVLHGLKTWITIW